MGYSIAQASKITGISVYTLRYYDKEGILPFVRRTASGIRDFQENDLEWLKIITCLKKTGMSIKHIKNYMELSLKGDETNSERLNIFYEQKKELEKKMLELEECMKMINYKIDYYKNAMKTSDNKCCCKS